MSRVELVVAMSLLTIVGLMGSRVRFGTSRVADQVTWRATANSDIRDLLTRFEFEGKNRCADLVDPAIVFIFNEEHLRDGALA